MAQINSLTKSPTIEDSILNRAREHVSYGVAEFNIRGQKELLVSSDKKNANASKYGQYIGNAVSATIGITSIATGSVGKITGKITSGIKHKNHQWIISIHAQLKSFKEFQKLFYPFTAWINCSIILVN